MKTANLFLLTLILMLVFSLPGSVGAKALQISTDEHTPAPPPLAQRQLEVEAATAAFWCGYNLNTDALLDTVTEETWSSWISRISGAEPVSVNGIPVTLTTRNSYALFDGNSLAFDYLRETLLSWYPPAFIEEDPYLPYFYQDLVWKNLVLTIPGTTLPEEVIILSAHYDSLPSSGPAPGADDNGSGSATLLEAARILQGQSFQRTIRLIWFTGEEQGLRGSAAYVNDHDLSNVVGVINMDMYAYDSDNDRCFELHVGTLPQSDQVGSCLVDAITAYNLNLSFDYLTTTATSRSDHASFWNQSVGAVEILENFFYNTLPGGCVGSDANPNYHRSTDTLDKINQSTALAITKAALAAAFTMANPDDPANDTFPPVLVSNTITPDGATLAVTLTLNEPGISRLHYGFLPGNYTGFVENSIFGLHQQADIPRNNSSATYYFLAELVDRSGNLSFSDEFWFADTWQEFYIPLVQK